MEFGTITNKHFVALGIRPSVPVVLVAGQRPMRVRAVFEEGR